MSWFVCFGRSCRATCANFVKSGLTSSLPFAIELSGSIYAASAWCARLLSFCCMPHVVVVVVAVVVVVLAPGMLDVLCRFAVLLFYYRFNMSQKLKVSIS